MWVGNKAKHSFLDDAHVLVTKTNLTRYFLLNMKFTPMNFYVILNHDPKLVITMPVDALAANCAGPSGIMLTEKLDMFFFKLLVVP